MTGFLLPDEELRMQANSLSASPTAAPSFLLPGEQSAPERASTVLRSVLPTNPEQAGKARRLAGEMDLPTPTVERNLDRVEQEARLRGIQDAMRLSPVLARQLTDPSFAALAHDDVDNLGRVANVLKPSRGPEPGVRSVISGILRALPQGAEAARQGIRQQFADLFGFEDMSADAGRKAARVRNEAALSDPEFESATARGVYGGLTSVVRQAPGLAASIITRSPTPALAAAGLQTEAEAYTKYRDRGASPALAGLGALGEGGTEVLTELAPMGFLVKKFGRVGAGQFLAGLLAREIPTEQAATLVQDAIDTAIANPDKTWGDYARERPGAAFETLISTMTQAGVIAGAGAAARRLGAIGPQEAEQNAAAIEQLAALAAASKVRERDTSSFAAFVNAAAEDGPVQNIHVSAQVFAQAAAENLPQMMQAMPSVGAQMAEALVTESELVIPLGEFAAAVPGTGLEQSLIDHIRTAPDAMTRAEAQTFMQAGVDELRRETEKALAEHTVDEAFKASAAKVEETLLGELKAANRFTDDVNKPYAQLAASFYGVQAARLGITPEEMYARYPLKVQASSVAGKRVMDQKKPPPVVATVYRGERNGGGRTGYQRNGAGRYFSSSKEAAALYTVDPYSMEKTGRVVKERVTLHNPYRHSGHILPQDATEADAQALTKRLIAKGHDGIVIDHGVGMLEYVVFDRTEFDQQTRGQISFADDITKNPSVVTLLQNADLSTFVHELGHFQLEVLAHISSQPNAPADIVADMNALLKWFGVADLAKWNGLTLEEKRPHHEQLARGFEAYLFEGKAPSLELQGIFQRMRAWMVNVYRQLTALNVTLTDEVRGVFDRLLATNEQIRTAEAARGYAPLFRSAEEMGATEAEWKAYQEQHLARTQAAVEQLQSASLRDLRWLANARSRAIKHMQRDVAEKRAAVEAEVRDEVRRQPVYAAQRFIANGELPEADRTNAQRKTLDDIAGLPHKLSTVALEEMYGDGPATPRRYLSPTLVAKDGMHPDIVAELFGYQSGDALVREIIAAEPEATVIEGITDQRMLERYGELTDQASIERAADAALANEAHTRALLTEHRALTKALSATEDTGKTDTRGRPVVRQILPKLAKAFAEQIVGRKVLKGLNPNNYTPAAARAGRAAEKATDLVEKATHKRNQIVQTYAARAAQEAVNDVRKGVEFFRRVLRGNNADVAKTRDADVVQAARAILAEYGIGTKGKTAQEYLKAVEAYDPAMHNVLRERVDALTANAKHYQDLTVDEFRALRDEIGAMWHLARRSRQMEVDGDLLDRKEVQAELHDRLVEIGIPDKAPGEDHAVTDSERRLAMLQTARAALRRVESWVAVKDGKSTVGPFRRFIWQPVRDAADRYRSDKATYLKRYRALLDAVAPTLKPTRIAAPELGYTFGYSRGGSGKAEILHALLHTGNESNLRKLLLGRGWATESAEGILDASQWDAFLQRMAAEGVITKADYDFVQGVWDLLEEMKPLAQKTHRDVFGHYFDEVTAAEVVTPFGNYRGGYVPALADPEVVSDAKTRALMEEENQTLQFAFPATARGFTKSRVDAYTKPLLLDLRSLAQHIDKVLLFSHLEQPVRDVRRVLTAKEVAYGLNRIDPAAFDGLLTPWLNRTARQQVETPLPGSGGLMRFFSAARSRAGMAAMFANVSNTVQQVTGFSLAAVKVKPGLLLGAAVDYIRSPREFARAVAERSPYMATRMENEVAQMSDAINDILLNPSVYERAKAWSARHAYFLQTAVDNAISPIVWTGAYNQALEQGLPERDAKRLADAAVRETQGSTLPEDVSRIETGNAFVRLFTQFAGYFNMQANLLGTEFSKLAQDVGLKKGAGRGLYVLLFGFLAPAWTAELIAQAFKGGPDDEDKDGSYLDDWLAAVLGFGTLRSATAMIPVAGQIVNAGVNTANAKPYDDRISTAPAISMIESAVRAPQSVYKAVFADGKPGKAVRDVATLISLTVGVPAYAVARPVSYLTDVAADRVEPTGPIDAVRGTVTGAASPESKR